MFPSSHNNYLFQSWSCLSSAESWWGKRPTFGVPPAFTFEVVEVSWMHLKNLLSDQKLETGKKETLLSLQHESIQKFGDEASLFAAEKPLFFHTTDCRAL